MARPSMREMTPEERRAIEAEERIRAARTAEQARSIHGPGAPQIPFPVAGGGPDGGLIIYPSGAPPEGESVARWQARTANARGNRGGQQLPQRPGREFSGRDEFEARQREALAGDLVAGGHIPDSALPKALVELGLGRIPPTPLHAVGIPPDRSQPQARGAAKPNPVPQGPRTEPPLGERKNVPWADVVANREAAEQEARAKTQREFDAIIASQRATEATVAAQKKARAAGYPDLPPEQRAERMRRDAAMDAVTALRERDNWIRETYKKNREAFDAQGITPDDLAAEYDQAHGITAAPQGLNPKAQLRWKLAQTRALEASDRSQSVKKRAAQYNMARRLGVSEGDIVLGDTIMDARNSHERAGALFAAHLARPAMGFGNAGMAAQQELAAGEGLDGARKPKPGPLGNAMQDNATIGQMPAGPDRLVMRQGQARMLFGEGADPRQIDTHIVQAEGALAGQTAVKPNPTPEERQHLSGVTESYVRTATGSDREKYKGWCRTLNIPEDERSAKLWTELTGLGAGGGWWPFG